jgi:hypothetical protein
MRNDTDYQYMGDLPDTVFRDGCSIDTTYVERYVHNGARRALLAIDDGQGGRCALCEHEAPHLVGGVAHDAGSSGLSFSSLWEAENDEYGNETEEPREAQTVFGKAIPKAPVATLYRQWVIRIVVHSRPLLSESPPGINPVFRSASSR